MPASPRSRPGASSSPAPAEDRIDREDDLDAREPLAAAPAAAPSASTSADEGDQARDGVDDLSFREAQLALELVLSQLQASDLDVEAMVALHRRGQAYAERCETLLRQVEQEVQLWDPEAPDASGRPFEAAQG